MFQCHVTAFAIKFVGKSWCNLPHHKTTISSIVITMTAKLLQQFTSDNSVLSFFLLQAMSQLLAKIYRQQNTKFNLNIRRYVTSLASFTSL